MWTVIIFIKDNTIEVVPINWLIGEKDELCYWPPKGNIKSLIINSAQPSDSWEVYGVRFPNNRKKTFDNFLKARSACNALAEDSEIVSDEETEKRKRKKKNFSSSEEEEEENQAKTSLPPPPPLPKNLMDPMQKINMKSLKTRVETPEHMVNINRTPTSSFPSLGNSQNSSAATLTTSQNDSRVLRQLVLINNKLDNLAKDIFCIIEKQDRASVPIEEDGEAVDQDFPLKTIDEIENFELKVQNKEYYSKFVHYISLLGGNGNWDSVKRAMERCFTDDIAQLFSWHGMKGKKSFGSLKFAKAVIEGIKKNLKKETDANLEKSIKSWLRHAKERSKKKSQLL